MLVTPVVHVAGTIMSVILRPCYVKTLNTEITFKHKRWPIIITMTRNTKRTKHVEVIMLSGAKLPLIR